MVEVSWGLRMDSIPFPREAPKVSNERLRKSIVIRDVSCALKKNCPQAAGEGVEADGQSQRESTLRVRAEED